MKREKFDLFSVTYIMVIVAIIAGVFIRLCVAEPLISHAQGKVNVATSTDVVATPTDVDTTLYLSYEMGNTPFANIQELLLSIRNILLMFFGFWFLTWAYSRMKIVIRLFYKKRR